MRLILLSFSWAALICCGCVEKGAVDTDAIGKGLTDLATGLNKHGAAIDPLAIKDIFGALLAEQKKSGNLASALLEAQRELDVAINSDEPLFEISFEGAEKMSLELVLVGANKVEASLAKLGGLPREKRGVAVVTPKTLIGLTSPADLRITFKRYDDEGKGTQLSVSLIEKGQSVPSNLFSDYIPLNEATVLRQAAVKW